MARIHHIPAALKASVPPEFVCPEQAPCKGITLDNVKLSGKDSKHFKMNCLNADGTAADGVVPTSCLKKAARAVAPAPDTAR